MKVVNYARYSGNSHVQPNIERQLEECRKYAERNGHVVVDEYVDLAHARGDRPQFTKMIADSKKGQFQAVLVYQFDRLGRNLCQSLENEYNLNKNGVRVVSVSENIPDGSSGNASNILLESVLEGMAAYCSAEHSAKIKRGITLKKQRQSNNKGEM